MSDRDLMAAWVWRLDEHVNHRLRGMTHGRLFWRWLCNLNEDLLFDLGRQR